MVPTNGLPLLLREGLEVALVPPRLKGPRSLWVDSCSERGGGALVSFGGIQTLGDASQIVGKTVLVRKRDLPDDFELHDSRSVVGREVVDMRLGPIGTVVDVMRGPAQDVWVVDGACGETLIPVVDAIVRSWEEGGPLVVDLPRGLAEEGSEACD